MDQEIKRLRNTLKVFERIREETISALLEKGMMEEAFDNGRYYLLQKKFTRRQINPEKLWDQFPLEARKAAVFQITKTEAILGARRLDLVTDLEPNYRTTCHYEGRT